MTLDQALFAKIEKGLFFLLILFLPTQLGKHFWPDFSVISGIRIDYLSPTLYFTDILIVLLFMCWSIRKMQSARFKAQNYSSKVKSFNFRLQFLTFNFKLLTIFLLYLVLNIIQSGNILNGFYHLLKLFEFSFVCFYIAYHVKNLKILQRVVLLLAISVIGQSLMATAQFFKQGSIGGLLYFVGERTFTSSTPGIANASINGELILRPYATFPHPNVLAGFLLFVMIMVLWLFKSLKKGWQRSISILCLLLGTGALILTMSRVAIVIWVVVVISYSINKWRKANYKWQILFALGLLFIILTNTPFGSRLLSTRLTEESVAQRQELINSSFKLFTQNPIFGIGLGNFLHSLPAVQKPLSPALYLQPVHNIFLLILVETGIIGLSFFVWFLIKTYRHLLLNLKTHAVFLVLLTTILILGLFDHYFLTLQQGQLLFAIVLGLCWTRFVYRA